jgi:hypothetical protein
MELLLPSTKGHADVFVGRANCTHVTWRQAQGPQRPSAAVDIPNQLIKATRAFGSCKACAACLGVSLVPSPTPKKGLKAQRWNLPPDVAALRNGQTVTRYAFPIDCWLYTLEIDTNLQT